jgi:hypothetical protein
MEPLITFHYKSILPLLLLLLLLLLLRLFQNKITLC